MNVFKVFFRWLFPPKISPAQLLEDRAWKSGHCYIAWQRPQAETLARFLTHQRGEEVQARFDIHNKCAVLSTGYQILARLTMLRQKDMLGSWLKVETDLRSEDYGIWFTLAFLKHSGVRIIYEPLETPLLLTHQKTP